MASEVVSQNVEMVDGVFRRLDELEATYLRRRGLYDGPEKNALDFILEHVAAVSNKVSDTREVFFDHALSNIGRLKRCTLNVAALVALKDQNWVIANRLATEVTSRDHHDLIAQRIVDAAKEQCEFMETEADQWLKTRRCSAPFDQIETRVNRTVHFCCSAWQPVPIGRIDGDEETEIWNSDVAKEIRRSVTSGNFEHCSRWHCPAVVARRLPKRNLEETPVVPAAPKRIILSHDRSCNISCPSCRKKLILLDQKTSAGLDQMVEQRLLPLLEGSEQIKVTGSGDPFGSRHFRNVLKLLNQQDARPRRIQIHTNGLLANERAWDELGLWDNVSSVWVSVDAADAETYSELRRGGEFQQLQSALRFLGVLRQSKMIDQFRLDFVVQARNYDQMGDFVDLSQRVNADGVHFLRIRNWGNQSAEEFREVDICNEEHPDYAHFMQFMQDPRLGQMNVDLGNLSSFRRQAQSNAIRA